MTSTHERTGQISLWLAIAGVVVPVLLAMVFHILAQRAVLPDEEGLFFLCGLLFAGLEIAALATGIVGRRTPSGKAGLIISACTLGLALVTIGLFTQHRVVME